MTQLYVLMSQSINMDPKGPQTSDNSSRGTDSMTLFNLQKCFRAYIIHMIILFIILYVIFYIIIQYILFFGSDADLLN